MPDSNIASRPVAFYLGRNLLVGGAERVFLNLVNNAQAVVPAVGLLERRGRLLDDLDPRVPRYARVDRTSIATEETEVASRFPGESFARLGLECLWLRNAVRSSGAAVVSSFLMRAHIVALVTKLTLLRDLPVVLNIHEHLSGSADYFYPNPRDRALMQWIVRNLFPCADRIVVVAEELKRDLVDSFGVPAGLIDVVHNGIDLNRVRAGALRESSVPPARPGTKTIVAVGRLVRLKGYDLLLRALAVLRERHDVRLVLVGDGGDRASLEQLAVSLDVASSVTFAGWQENPWSIVARADVLAMTSRTEAFPCVLTEAMALGVPVLATDCSGGVSECLSNGECGVIVPSENHAAIATGLERLLVNDELRSSLGAAGRVRAESFALHAAQRRYESVLETVIASRTT